MYGYALISVDMLWANKPEGKLPYQILSVHIQEIQNIINERWLDLNYCWVSIGCLCNYLKICVCVFFYWSLLFHFFAWSFQETKEKQQRWKMNFSVPSLSKDVPDSLNLVIFIRS